MDDSFCHP